jgi:hypothetical protein
MQNAAAWEYHAERLPDQADVVNDSMRLLGDAGWELVSATSACAPVRQGSTQVWQVTYTLFWRRPRPDANAA